jgi:hypothetical protein
MKKLLLCLCLTVGTAITYAQGYGNDDKKITIGIAGGSNYAWFSVKAVDQEDVSTDLETPFSIGLNVDFKINDYFSIRPGIIYQGKGSKVDVIAMYSAQNSYRLHYLEIPIDFIGHVPIGSEGANIFFGGGPFMSLALNGNKKQTANDVVTNEAVKFGNNGDFKSTDFGVTTVLGFQVGNGMAVSANLDFGLVNILKNSDLNMGATSAKTGVFYVSFGQSF